jgi:ABC-2 type transport system permease protein
MTTAILTPAAPARLKVTQIRVLLSEWTKFRSLRSTTYTLFSAVVLMVGLGALISAVTASHYSSLSAAERLAFNPITTSLGGITFAELAIGVLGVMMMTGEYSTGMIRASLTAVPRRLPVLWAKLGVFAGVVAAVSLVTSFGSFFLGQALLNGHGLGVSISAPHALSSVIGATVYMTVAGMIAVGVGALMRNTAAGISTFVATFFLLPPLAQLLPGSIGDHITKYLPSNAGSALYGGGLHHQDVLSSGAGFAVLVGYAVLIVGAAAWRLRRTDA